MEQWKVKDRAFAYSEDDGYWYPVVITGISSAGVSVRFECDDTEAVVAEDYLDELSLEVGDEVESSDAEGYFYSAVVKQVKGDQLLLEYDDESTEWVAITAVRMADAWQEGDEALIYCEEDGYWYTGVITKIDDDGFHVRYDCDESEETVEADYLDEIYLETGEEVECLDADDEYVSVTVTNVDVEQIQVKFEDGETAWVPFDKLRFFDFEEEEEDEE